MAASPGAQVFFISDRKSGEKFLVDTGANRSLYPRAKVNDPGPRGHDMHAANGSGIATFGRTQVSIEADGQRYLWPFLIADVCLPMLGAAFLKHYDLLVDVRRQKLYRATTSQLSATAVADDYATLKQTFKGIFQGKLGATRATAKHPVKHYIKTTRPPDASPQQKGVSRKWRSRGSVRRPPARGPRPCI